MTPLFYTCPTGYMAVDDDRFDGAEDGDRTIGYGETKAEALADLIEQYDN